eukprot:6615285-Prymnesium_polylepis.1
MLHGICANNNAVFILWQRDQTFGMRRRLRALPDEYAARAADGTPATSGRASADHRAGGLSELRGLGLALGDI